MSSIHQLRCGLSGHMCRTCEVLALVSPSECRISTNPYRNLTYKSTNPMLFSPAFSSRSLRVVAHRQHAVAERYLRKHWARDSLGTGPEGRYPNRCVNTISAENQNKTKYLPPPFDGYGSCRKGFILYYKSDLISTCVPLHT